MIALIAVYEQTTAPEDLILPMDSESYVDWLKTDRYGGDNFEELAVLNFVNIINSAPGWEEKELITYKVLEDETRRF